MNGDAAVIDQKLYSLIQVAETGNFTKAAQALSLSQPAVSQHIRTLEEDLNIKIFERGKNSLRITLEGAIVLKYAKRMLALENRMKRELSAQKRQPTSLTIGITHTSESNAIAEAMANYVDNHRGVHIKLVTDTQQTLYDKLKNYELDLAIVEGKLSDPSLKYLMLDTDCLVLAISPTHRLADKSIVTINDLKKEKLILRLPNSGTRNMFAASLERNGLSIGDFNVTMEIDNIATIKDLIRRNFGVSVLARSACMDEVHKKKITVLPIEDLSMIREINIVYLQDFDHFDLLRDIIRSYQDTTGKG